MIKKLVPKACMGPPVHSISLKFSLHIVYIFKETWNFLTNF